MNYRSIFCRLACMALALGFLFSGRLHAQGIIKECNCKSIIIAVDAAVACKVNVVVIYPTLPSPIVTVAPGTKVGVPCEVGAEVTLVDCMNHKNQLGPDGCLHSFPADVGCCVDACLTQDANGCYVLEVKPSFTRCICQ